MPADVKPYLVPLNETVVWEPWFYRSDDGWAPLPDEIDGWDPGIDLHVTRRVRVDPVRLGQETGIGAENVALPLSWTSSSKGMTDAGQPVGFGSDGVAVIDAVLLGERLSGILAIRSTICLARPPATFTAGVASIPGSILAEHLSQVVL